jgi:spore coat protein A, manganese oxidase
MKKISRRQFLKGSMMAGAYLAAGGAGALFKPKKAYAFAQSPNLKKFVWPLRNPLTGGIPLAASDGVRNWPALTATGIPVDASVGVLKWGAQTATHYTIGISEYRDQLHPQLTNGTRLWGYGQNGNYKHLGGIIVAKRDAPVQITFQNNLPDSNIVPVDTTIPGAKQAQNRTAVHLHGGLVPWISDGGPFDWWAPDGSHGDSFLNNKVLNPSAKLNEAEYYYPNGQGARLEWYHDHAFGITRTNAYAGIASGYVITDAYEALLSQAPYYIPGPLDPRTLYLIFQDKIFFDGANDPGYPVKGAQPGDLWYAHTYEADRWQLSGGVPPDPSVVPEFFGDTILVNGTVYPYVEVEPRQYRLRALNACNARFLNPRLYYADSTGTDANPLKPGPSFVQIGSEGGFLPYPAYFNTAGQRQLLMAPAERADLIVDFRNVPAGSILILYSDAPAPFPNGDTRNDYYPGNPDTPSSIPGAGPNTRTLLQIRVKARTKIDPPIRLPNYFMPTDPFLIFQKPTVPVPYVPSPSVQMPFAAATDASGMTFITLANGKRVPVKVRQLTLNEDFDSYGRLIQYLGTNVPSGPGPVFGLEYLANPTEVVRAGSYEIWEIANLTGDTHPIHFHLVNVQILSRQAFDAVNYAGTPRYTAGPTAPDFNELGWKETVRMNPGQVTRVLMKFDLPAVPFTVPASPRTGGNEYVWHCHILEHEEHDMMRPIVVV